MSSSTGLDNRFFLLTPIQEMLVDKDTGAPLAGGVVTFYSQDSQSVLKDIYTLSGSGPFSTASYKALPNPMILSSVGTFVDDNGNDIVPYLFPYDGAPTNSTNTVQLYYITVYNSAGVLQFTRQAWPNVISTSTNVNEVENFIPNGQFLLHNNNPVVLSNVVVPANPAGGGSNADVSLIAQGGWSFQVPHGTTSINSVTFTTNSGFTDPDVTADPRYYVNVACTNIGSGNDAYKDLCIQFPDVNKFATNSSSPNWTLSFQGQSNNGASLSLGVRLLKYFGSAGGGVTPTASTDVAFGASGTTTISSLPNQAPYNIPGLFGSNSGMTVGVNGDDYVQIALRFPVNQIFNASFTDFVLTNGNVTVTGFPVTTNNQMISTTAAGTLNVPNPNSNNLIPFLQGPNPDGSSLYLPIKLGPNGFIVDTSEIGNIVAKTNTANFSNSISTVSNELLCDGAQYSFTGYSPIGVPYYRLANAIFDSTSGNYFWGSGANWINTYISTGSSSQLITIVNTPGSFTAPADSVGGTATGYTFNLNNTPGHATYNYKAYANSSASVTAISTFTTGTNGSAGFADGGAHPTGMTFTSITNPASTVGYYAAQFTALSAASLANTGSAGKFFTFSDHSTNYYVWFFVSNETDPAPGGQGIKCQLTSTMSAADVATVIAAVMSGFQEFPITITGQPTGGAGSYWTFYSNLGGTPTQTAVWYQINGLGTAPGITSKVMVAIGNTDTAAQIATKTRNAINQAYFATPNLQNMFLRGTGTAANSVWGDVDQGTRFALDTMLTSSSIGTFEIGQVVNHSHSGSSLTATLNITGEVNNAGSGQTVSLNGQNHGQNANFPGSVTISGNTALTGGSESRPANAFVTWAIKY